MAQKPHLPVLPPQTVNLHRRSGLTTKCLSQSILLPFFFCIDPRSKQESASRRAVESSSRLRPCGRRISTFLLFLSTTTPCSWQMGRSGSRSPNSMAFLISLYLAISVAWISPDLPSTPLTLKKHVLPSTKTWVGVKKSSANCLAGGDERQLANMQSPSLFQSPSSRSALFHKGGDGN